MKRFGESLEKEIKSFSVLTKVPTEILVDVLDKMSRECETDKHGKKIYIAKYKFEGAGDLTDPRNNKVKFIKKVFEDLLDTQAEAFTDRLYKKSNIIASYKLTRKSIVEISLSDDLLSRKLINKESHGIIELDEFYNLKTKFSREFYRLFKQSIYIGKVSIRKDELFKVLKVPKNYTDLNFIDKALNPSFFELKKYFDNLTFDNLETSSTGELPEVCEFSFKKYERKSNEKIFKGKSKEEIEVFKVIMNS